MPNRGPLTEMQDAVRRYADAAASALRDSTEPVNRSAQLHHFAESARESLREREGIKVDQHTMERAIRKRDVQGI